MSTNKVRVTTSDKVDVTVKKKIELHIQVCMTLFS